MLHSILYFFVLMSPHHDFHTSWMTMTFDEKNKEFGISLRLDTEHLEGALLAYSGKEIHLEDSTINNYQSIIGEYIDEHTAITLNKSVKKLNVNLIEVNFAETIVHFKPIKCRKKLRTVAMVNTLLIDQLPNQKNMVQLNYEGKSYSLLMERYKMNDKLEL